MIIQISKEVYDSLSDSEQQVINYLNENESSIPLMSITTIAENVYLSGNGFSNHSEMWISRYF